MSLCSVLYFAYCYTECQLGVCRYAQYRLAKFRYAEYRGAVKKTLRNNLAYFKRFTCSR